MPVPEPKFLNRIHWDLAVEGAAAVDELVRRGARVLRESDDDISWTGMAGPEDNESCVFAP